MSKYATKRSVFSRAALLPLAISSSLAFAELSFVEVPVSLDYRVGTDVRKGVGVSNNGVVAVANIDQTFTWSIADGTSVLGAGSPGPYSVYISNDGSVVAATASSIGTGDDVIYVDGQLLNIDTSDLSIRNVSPDGSRIAVRSNGAAGTYHISDDSLTLHNGIQTLGYSSDSSKTFLQTSASYFNTGEVIANSDGTQTTIDTEGKLWSLPWHPGITGNGQSIIGESVNCDSGASICFVRLDLQSDQVTEIDTGGVSFRPMSANSDGTLVLADGHGVSEEFDGLVWDDINGVRSFKQMLLSKGLNVAGWSEFRNLEISDDGTKIAGTAVNPDGIYRAFLVTDLPVCTSGFK